MRIGLRSIAFTILFFCFPSVVFAHDDYDLDTYQSYVHTSWDLNPFGNDEIGQMLNYLANSLFSCNKMISKTIAFMIEKLFNLDVISNPVSPSENLSLLDKFNELGIALWDSLYSAFGMFLFLITTVWIFCTAVLGQTRLAMRQALICFLVIGIAFSWKTVGGQYLKGVNTLTTEAQTKMMSAMSTIRNNEKNGNGAESSIETVVDLYFDLTIKKPFLLMNYGTVDENEINTTNPNRSTSLLRTSVSAETWKEIDKYIADHESGNIWITPDKVTDKLSISFFSVLFSLLLGIPFLLISALNFLIQLVALVLFAFLPFAFILSFIPRFSQAMFVALRNLLALFGFKLIIGILFLLLIYLIDFVQMLIPARDEYSYRFQIAMISIIIIVIYIKRKMLISHITGGMLRKVEPEFVTNGAKKVASLVITAMTSSPQEQQASDEASKVQSKSRTMQDANSKGSPKPKRSAYPSENLNQQVKVNRTPQNEQVKLEQDTAVNPLPQEQHESDETWEVQSHSRTMQDTESEGSLEQERLTSSSPSEKLNPQVEVNRIHQDQPVKQEQDAVVNPLPKSTPDGAWKAQSHSQTMQGAESKENPEPKRFISFSSSENLNPQVEVNRIHQNQSVKQEQDTAVNPLLQEQHESDETWEVQPHPRTMQDTESEGSPEPERLTSSSPSEKLNPQVEVNRIHQNQPVKPEQDTAVNSLPKSMPDGAWKAQSYSRTMQDAESEGSPEPKRLASPSENLNQQVKMNRTSQNQPVKPEQDIVVNPLPQRASDEAWKAQSDSRTIQDAESKEGTEPEHLTSFSRPEQVDQQVNTRRKLFVEMQQLPVPPSHIKRPYQENQNRQARNERDQE